MAQQQNDNVMRRYVQGPFWLLGWISVVHVQVNTGGFRPRQLHHPCPGLEEASHNFRLGSFQ